MHLKGMEVTTKLPAGTGENKYYDIASQLLRLKQTYDINKINTKRVAQGLPPVDAGVIAPQVRVGADPTQLRNVGIFAAAGLLVVLLVMRRRRG